MFDAEMTPLNDDYRVCASGTWYADIKQRWLLVRSRQAHERETKQLHAKIARQEAKWICLPSAPGRMKLPDKC